MKLIKIKPLEVWQEVKEASWDCTGGEYIEKPQSEYNQKKLLTNCDWGPGSTHLVQCTEQSDPNIRDGQIQQEVVGDSSHTWRDVMNYEL